jgi:hypothetical protein
MWAINQKYETALKLLGFEKQNHRLTETVIEKRIG